MLFIVLLQFVPSGTGPTSMVRAQTRHPLDPLAAAEISIAVATVRAAGATPEVNDCHTFVALNHIKSYMFIL